ncbi:MAG: MBL fold metallo-hydrolase [bacterium]
MGNVLFSGDTIFKSSIGKADLYDSSYDDEISSIKNKILPLPLDTIIYPGYGPETTVKDEKPYF